MADQKKIPQIILTDNDKKEKKVIIHPSEPMQFPAILIDRRVVLPGLTMNMVITVQDYQLSFVEDILKQQLSGAMPVALVCIQARTEEAISVRRVATLGYVRGCEKIVSNGLAIIKLEIEAVDRIRLVSLAPYVFNGLTLKDFKFQQAA